MEQEPYISCIKINGVPILPPLMTDNLRMEMNYYKQLAIAVEEKLKILEIAKQAETDKLMDNIAEECKSLDGRQVRTSDSYDSTTEDSCVTEAESSTVESTPNVETIIDIPTKENGHKSQFSSLNTSLSETTTETLNQSFKSSHDDESKATITASTDLNQYLDFSRPPTQQTSTDTSPELVKPQVPKTLNIIPITVQVSEQLENGESADKSPRSNTPPKLVRQGSYILEAPSPMLLAHMQTELANPGYVPTTTTTAMKRKEWNISQAKSEWENQIQNKEFVIPNNSRNNSDQGRYRRNSISTVNNQKTFKTLSHTKNSPPFGTHQSAKSVDCIQTMLDKELVCRSPSTKVNGCNQKHNVKGSCTRSNNWYNCRSSRNVSILNLSNRLGGSLGNLENFCGQSGPTANITKSPLQSKIIENTQSSPSPSKSIGMSEKLVIIFKEIQRKHEEQMAELIAKQQKEQKSMQMEFEKQQVLLLGQIEKSFPGISIPPPIETIPDIATQILSNCVEESNLVSHLLTQDDESYRSNNTDPSIVKCPLDYIYPLSAHSASIQMHSDNIPESPILKSNPCPAKTSNSIDQSSDIHNQSIHRTHNSMDKYSNVSRRLFPLDSKTVHVPVPVNIPYTAKHIRAATTINAYARGYLVRRMMSTERVIALKNTYKEALHCMLKLHIDAPLNLPELNFHQRLQLQCDAASINITELFAQNAKERMRVISQDREIKLSRSERPSSAHSYSFATQRTLARKKLKEMGDNYSSPPISRPCSARSRCQTWTSNSREKRSQNIYHGIKRSTSAGTVRKPWR